MKWVRKERRDVAIELYLEDDQDFEPSEAQWDAIENMAVAFPAHVPPSNVPPIHTTQGVIGKPGG